MEHENFININAMKKLFIFLPAILLLACGAEKKEENESQPEETVENQQTEIQLTPDQIEIAEITIDSLQKHEFYNEIRVNGVIDLPPENKASISTYFSGYIKEIHILPGQKVRKGQVLFSLENPEYVFVQQNFLETKEALNYLKLDYERQKNLAEDKFTSQKEFVKAETEYNSMRAKFEALKKQLQMMHLNTEKLKAETITSVINVTSPIDGFLSSVEATKGMFLNPSDIAATVINTDHMHLELSVFEKDINNIKIGQPINFHLLNDSEKAYKAEVYLIGKSIDPENRTVNIHAHLEETLDENIETNFTTGMYVEARIMAGSQIKNALPNDAIVEIDQKYYALLLQGTENKVMNFKRVDIIPGKKDNQFTEVVNHSEFKSNSIFMTKGAFNLIKE